MTAQLTPNGKHCLVVESHPTRVRLIPMVRRAGLRERDVAVPPRGGPRSVGEIAFVDGVRFLATCGDEIAEDGSPILNELCLLNLKKESGGEEDEEEVHVVARFHRLTIKRMRVVHETDEVYLLLSDESIVMVNYRKKRNALKRRLILHGVDEVRDFAVVDVKSSSTTRLLVGGAIPTLSRYDFIKSINEATEGDDEEEAEGGDTKNLGIQKATTMISSALSSLFSRTLTNVIGLEPISLPSSDFDEGETKMEAVNVYPELSFNDVGRVVMKLEVDKTRLGAISDTLGRICLFHTKTLTLIHIFKGYRESSFSFFSRRRPLVVLEGSKVSSGDDDDDDDEKPFAEDSSSLFGEREEEEEEDMGANVYLAIHAPHRDGVIEVYNVSMAREEIPQLKSIISASTTASSSGGSVRLLPNAGFYLPPGSSRPIPLLSEPSKSSTTSMVVPPRRPPPLSPDLTRWLSDFLLHHKKRPLYYPTSSSSTTFASLPAPEVLLALLDAASKLEYGAEQQRPPVEMVANFAEFLSHVKEVCDKGGNLYADARGVCDRQAFALDSLRSVLAKRAAKASSPPSSSFDVGDDDNGIDDMEKEILVALRGSEERFHVAFQLVLSAWLRLFDPRSRSRRRRRRSSSEGEEGEGEEEEEDTPSVKRLSGPEVKSLAVFLFDPLVEGDVFVAREIQEVITLMGISSNAEASLFLDFFVTSRIERGWRGCKRAGATSDPLLVYLRRCFAGNNMTLNRYAFGAEPSNDEEEEDDEERSKNWFRFLNSFIEEREEARGGCALGRLSLLVHALEKGEEEVKKVRDVLKLAFQTCTLLCDDKESGGESTISIEWWRFAISRFVLNAAVQEDADSFCDPFVKWAVDREKNGRLPESNIPETTFPAPLAASMTRLFLGGIWNEIRRLFSLRKEGNREWRCVEPTWLEDPSRVCDFLNAEGGDDNKAVDRDAIDLLLRYLDEEVKRKGKIVKDSTATRAATTLLHLHSNYVVPFDTTKEIPGLKRFLSSSPTPPPSSSSSSLNAESGGGENVDGDDALFPNSMIKSLLLATCVPAARNGSLGEVLSAIRTLGLDRNNSNEELLPISFEVCIRVYEEGMEGRGGEELLNRLLLGDAVGERQKSSTQQHSNNKKRDKSVRSFTPEEVLVRELFRRVCLPRMEKVVSTVRSDKQMARALLGSLSPETGALFSKVGGDFPSASSSSASTTRNATSTASIDGGGDDAPTTKDMRMLGPLRALLIRLSLALANVATTGSSEASSNAITATAKKIDALLGDIEVIMVGLRSPPAVSDGNNNSAGDKSGSKTTMKKKKSGGGLNV